MAPRTVILIPPSEAKAPGGNGSPWEPGDSAFPELDRDRARVLKALGRAHPARTGPTSPAMKRYTGVLYRELDAGSLRGTAHRRLDRNVLVASGLWGLVAPTDSIPDYKLKMGARLEPLGKLSTWWRPRLTAALTQRVKGAVVWDLLPHEHAAAVHWPDLAPRTRVTVQFLDAGGRTVSHWNKLLKGSISGGWWIPGPPTLVHWPTSTILRVTSWTRLRRRSGRTSRSLCFGNEADSQC